jgi:hypothetical protein
MNGQFITKKIIDWTGGGMKYILDVSDLSSGVYIIEFIVEDKRVLKKIII